MKIVEQQLLSLYIYLLLFFAMDFAAVDLFLIVVLNSNEFLLSDRRLQHANLLEKVSNRYGSAKIYCLWEHGIQLIF